MLPQRMAPGMALQGNQLNLASLLQRPTGPVGGPPHSIWPGGGGPTQAPSPFQPVGGPPHSVGPMPYQPQQPPFQPVGGPDPRQPFMPGPGGAAPQPGPFAQPYSPNMNYLLGRPTMVSSN